MKQKTKFRFPFSLNWEAYHEHFGKQHQWNVHEAKRHRRNSTSILDKQSILLLVVNGLFLAANALSGTFINVYLWKEKSDFSLIAQFALANQITMALTFWIAGKMVKEYNKMNALRFGVGVSALFYLFILVLGKESTIHYVLLLGFVEGLAFGLFWLAFNVIYFEVTEPENRDRFNGWAGLLGSGSGIIAPWISGYLITHMKDLHGYRLIFSISIVLFIIGVIVSFFLKKRKVEGTYAWFYSFSQLKVSGNPWRYIVLALFSQGIREGVFAFLIGLLVYITTKNEMMLGDYTLVVSAVGLFSYMLAGRFLKPHFRKTGMLLGVLTMISVLFLFYWKVNYTTLLLFGIGTALVFPFYTIPMTSAVFDIIGQDRESAKLRVEYVVLRELALNAGRIFGTIVFLIVISWNTSPRVINTVLLLIGSSPLLAWLFMRKRLAIRFKS